MTRNPVGDNEAFSAVYWSSILNAHDDEFITQGLAPSKGAGNFEVTYTAGKAYNGVEFASVNAGSVTLATANATNPRVDLITVDPTDGSVQSIGGTAASNPAAPDIPDGDVVIGVVFVPAGATSITAANIHDYRTLAREPGEVALAVDMVMGAW